MGDGWWRLWRGGGGKKGVAGGRDKPSEGDKSPQQGSKSEGKEYIFGLDTDDEHMSTGLSV